MVLRFTRKEMTDDRSESQGIASDKEGMSSSNGGQTEKEQRVRWTVCSFVVVRHRLNGKKSKRCESIDLISAKSPRPIGGASEFPYSSHRRICETRKSRNEDENARGWGSYFKLEFDVAGIIILHEPS